MCDTDIKRNSSNLLFAFLIICLTAFLFFRGGDRFNQKKNENYFVAVKIIHLEKNLKTFEAAGNNFASAAYPQQREAAIIVANGKWAEILENAQLIGLNLKNNPTDNPEKIPEAVDEVRGKLNSFLESHPKVSVIVKEIKDDFR